MALHWKWAKRLHPNGSGLKMSKITYAFKMKKITHAFKKWLKMSKITSAFKMTEDFKWENDVCIKDGQKIFSIL